MLPHSLSQEDPKDSIKRREYTKKEVTDIGKLGANTRETKGRYQEGGEGDLRMTACSRATEQGAALALAPGGKCVPEKGVQKSGGVL